MRYKFFVIEKEINPYEAGITGKIDPVRGKFTNDEKRVQMA